MLYVIVAIITVDRNNLCHHMQRVFGNNVTHYMNGLIPVDMQGSRAMSWMLQIVVVGNDIVSCCTCILMQSADPDHI